MKRITSNYLRLLTTFAAGVLIVRLMGEIGHAALVLYLLLIAGVGFAFLLKTVLRDSVIPVLGLSYEGAGGRRFAEAYWASFLSGVISAGFAVLVFAALWLMSDLFETGGLGEVAIAVAFASVTIQGVAGALGTPFVNAVLIDRRVVAYNLFLALERLLELAAVLVAWGLPPEVSVDERLITFYVLGGALNVLLRVGIFLYAVRVNPRFRLRRVPLQRADVSWVGAIMGWNLAIVAGFLFYARVPTLVVNAGIGAAETLTLGLVLTLIGYQRQVSMGLVIGLDAAVSRHYGAEDGPEEDRARALVLRSTYVQTVFAAFSTAALWIFIESVFRLWLGDSLAGSGWDQALSVLLFQIMSVGMLARAMSETWMKFFAGKGAVSRFAPWVLAGGVFNGLGCVIAVAVLEPADALLAVGAIYAVLNLLVHAGVMGGLLVRELKLSLPAFLGLLVLPLVLAVAAAALCLSVFETATVPGAVASLGVLALAGLAALTGLRFAARVPDRLA